MTLSIFRCFLLVLTVFFSFVFLFDEKNDTLFSFRAHTHMWFPLVYHGYWIYVLCTCYLYSYSTLHHADPPSFVERPQNVESEMGDNITMNCLVDSNPKADIIWVFDPIDRVSTTVHSFFLFVSFFLITFPPTWNPCGIACSNSLIMEILAFSLSLWLTHAIFSPHHFLFFSAFDCKLLGITD